MTRKIRAGLYEYNHVIDDNNFVVYPIVPFDGEMNVGPWVLRYRIGLDEDVSDQWYATKAEALATVRKMAGNWSYHPGLGWCYGE